MWKKEERQKERGREREKEEKKEKNQIGKKMKRISVKERENGKLILITSHLLSELDDMLTDIIFMQESEVIFNKTITALFEETNESRVSKAISKLLKSIK